MKIRDLIKEIGDFDLSNIPRLAMAILLIALKLVVYIARLYNVLFWIVFPLSLGYVYLEDDLFASQRSFYPELYEPYELSSKGEEVISVFLITYVLSLAISYAAKRFHRATNNRS